MENRERDKMSRNTESTSAGDVNRNTSSQSGKNKSDSSADFGQNIGRSEISTTPTAAPATFDRRLREFKSPNRSSGDKSTGSVSWDSKSNRNDSSSGSRH